MKRMAFSKVVLSIAAVSLIAAGCASGMEGNSAAGTASISTEAPDSAGNASTDEAASAEDSGNPDVESAVVSGGTYEAPAQEPADETVALPSGQIRGTVDDGIYRFLGVPYAEAKERFTEAGEVTPWEGVREAYSYGDTSPQQGILGMGGNDAGDGRSNNCQNLNIWTPGLFDGKKRPVMVWLHGGGFSTGSANEEGYDGEALSRKGDVVVIGVNSRLNVFGFLDLAEYGEKYRYSANIGVSDIQKSLEWIRENAELFGGDPDNITLFGQSGGGAKILALMTSPYAEGLFNKGIIESGATEVMGVRFISEDVSRKVTEKTLEKLGITKENIEDIQTVPSEDLLNASGEALSEVAQEEKIPASLGNGYELAFEPVVDGDYIPTDPVTEGGFAAAGKDVTIMIGTNLVEWAGFVQSLQYPDVTEKQQEAFDRAYPDADPDTIKEVDTLLRLPILKITAHKADQGGAQVYSYVFTEGNYHGAEIPYVFAHEDNKTGQIISKSWLNFARNGVPSADGVPEWEPYTRESGAVMLLNSDPTLVHHHDEELLHLLEPDYVW